MKEENKLSDVDSFIRIRGAREHNLKNVNLDIPRDKLVVITGLSGSGKSSLAFDTIYAEGQRRYVESLSSYARQFLGQMEKPEVDQIEGLSPAISIEQKTTHRNPRSTVGTVTEIYDYLRLLYARVGKPHCPKCGTPISSLSVDQITDRINLFPEGTKLQIMAPVIQGKKGEHKEVLERYKKEGFNRVRVNGEVYSLEDEIPLKKNFKADIDIVVDRIVMKPGIQSRLSDSVETALKTAEGIVVVEDGEKDHLFSQKLSCPKCDDVSIPELTPRLFSFNSPFGACSNCDGLGALLEFDESLLVTDREASLAEGCIEAWGGSKSNSYWYMATIQALSKKLKFNLNTAWKDLPEKVRNTILHGDSSIHIDYDFRGANSHYEFSKNYEGVIPNLKRRYKETKSDSMRQWFESFMTNHDCDVCNGKRLRPEALAVKVQGIGIDAYTGFSIEKALDFTKSSDYKGAEDTISKPILKEILQRLHFLNDVGVGYLNLSRAAGTLSGGEMQRIRLATQIGSRLMGVLYILDEPSIGLHQRDNTKLVQTLKGLRNLGNTVLVVEHDKETMEEADFIVDMGPGAGVHGGEIVSFGTPEQIKKDKHSVTGKFLSGEKRISMPETRRVGNGKFLKITGATHNNLKNVDVSIPLGTLTVVTGVSGSGKSTLINEILYKELASSVMGMKLVPGKHKKILGKDQIDKVINIDQSAIGRTPRSNPATYTGLFTFVRDLFSGLEEAKVRGYGPGRFSFNVAGGRCEKCEGDGILKIEMHFLPDIYVECEVCKGKRYNRETLEVKYKGKHISDILDMTVEEAVVFFENIPNLKRKLDTLMDVGLGYIKLGQAATTFSGGEAQRIKLSTELSKRPTGKTLYILDEPTTGLHFEDIEKLLSVLQVLVDKGNSMVIIEHNLDVIKAADYIIDIGPEGGDGGGEVIATGTPEEIVTVKRSFTGQYLKKVLDEEKALDAKFSKKKSK
ncbi:excinuclease ABC subunit UvrA [Leptospira meyeri]|uniref:UvrABC system protein A n=1 Tax=Leptospira meyeri TaxID=29508 RepID=A0A4R8MTL1_LEPME|nr:excinuclease ABC subunit UvrA [Leptospira meyeri]EKJ85522.1 excinuclease ABC, A subunit [Leptospira meyeri serovar Hardjo str. Went 5]MCW7490209.1 excinuclease ABC subunit UvrA [Leptospira meyeri]PKA13829.1 excinuclease ABC subunit A [Leptospira meyeri]TDY71408.1 excinuclease ABC subunit A [Leptospira meyeri]TGL10581.1 excinuclease ABC subunit UvrA [Leptospira meyeri]